LTVLSRKYPAADLFVAVEFADSFFRRLKGLLGRSSLDVDELLVFRKCNSIHTIGMRFEIDIIFLDKQQKVVKLVKGLKPNRFAVAKGAVTVLEAKAGSIEEYNIEMNQELLFRENDCVKNNI